MANHLQLHPCQAIDDGVLIDVTTQAKQLGFRVHTVVTDHLYNEYVVPPSGLEGEGQSVEGRLHDLLFSIFGCGTDTWDWRPRPEFDVMFLMAQGRWDQPVVAVIGPGDQGEPVVSARRRLAKNIATTYRHALFFAPLF